MSKLTRRSFLSAAAAVAASCAAGPNLAQPAPTTEPTTRPRRRPPVITGPTTQPFPPTLEAWRSAFGPGEFVQKVRRPESKANLPNPHKGTTTFQRFNGDPVNMDNRWNDRDGPETFGEIRNGGVNQNYPQTTMSYCRWIWSRLEPERGQYRWEIIDGALDAAARRGQTLQMRFQPFIGRDFPQWYLDSGDRYIAVGNRREHEHNSADYIKFWGELIAAAGKRYDGHPALESFDIAYGGPCGETGGNATPETAARLVDAYVNAFPKTQLITMLGTPGCQYAASLKGKNIGWRADCYGDVRLEGSPTCPPYSSWNHMLDAYPMELFRCGVQDAWKNAPITFETCWTVGYWFNHGWDIDWILEQGLAYHASVFMPKSSYIPEQWKEKIDAFNRKLGYRFVLRQLLLPLRTRPGAVVPFEFWIENVGVAPIYRPYALALRLRQEQKQVIVPLKADPRTWMPGQNWFCEQVTLPETFGPGPVAMDLAIVDPQNQKPRVQFAIQGRGEDGWYPMTFLDLDPQASTAPVRSPVTGQLRELG